MQRKRMTPQERKKLRAQEIRKKVDVLKGRMGDRYRKERDKAKGGEDPKAQEQQSEEEAEEGAKSGAKRRSLEDDEEEGGEGQKEWVFERKAAARSRVRGQEKVSENARAVAAAELSGAGGIASAKQLLGAAEEFGFASEHEQALALAEAARPRIDREQLDRKLGALAAQALDDRAMWQIGESNEALGRYTLAVDTFGQLKERPLDKKDIRRATKSWAAAAYKLSEKLYNAMRFDDSVEVLELITETTKKSVIGDRLYEDSQLLTAMALQQLGRVPEAKEILQDVRRNTYSKQTKAQASFVLDVFSVDTTGERNEEFHKMWEANFRLPDDSYRSQVRVGGGSSLQLSDREREWRDWASRYWEERMKSPAYYLFLTLWVTWPFAIPVISIMKKMQLVAP